MNANVTKTNGVKLFALVAVLAMVFAGAAVMMDDSVDAATGETTYISGGITAGSYDPEKGVTLNEQKYEAGSKVVVNDDLVIPNYAKLTINGATLIVNEGVTVTIQPGGQLVLQNDAKVEINGTIIADGTISAEAKQYTLASPGSGVYYAGAIVNTVDASTDDTGVYVSGSISVDKGADLTGENGVITILEGGSISITKRSSNVSLVDDQTFNLNTGATLTVNGYVGDTGITINAYGNATYYTAGSMKLTGSATNSGRDSSELTFTVTTETVSAYIGNDASVTAGTAATVDPVTIRQYVLDVSGTVAIKNKLSIIEGSYVGPSPDFTSGNRYYTVDDDEYGELITAKTTVTGTLTVDEVSSISFGESSSKADTYTVISGTLDVKYKDFSKSEDKETNGQTFIYGVIEITGTAKADQNSIVTKDVYGFVKINGGTMTISNFDLTKYSMTIDFYGAMYEDDVNNVNTAYFSDLQSAVDGAAAVGEDVYVFGSYNSKISANMDNGVNSVDKAIANGGYVLTGNVTIPDGVALIVNHALVVPEEYSLTFAVGSDADLDNGYSMIYVLGKVIDQDGVFELNAEDVIDYEVSKVSEDELTTTYTTLAIALGEAQPGETIELNGIVNVTENMTIPADVTVVTADVAKAISISNGAALTINGTLEMGGSTATISIGKTTDDKVDGSIVLNGIIAECTAQKIVTDAADGYTVAGAYFTGTIGDYEGVAFITSVAIAAEASSTVETGDITINGTSLSIGDVTFTSGNDAGLNVVVNAGTVTAGTVTLDGATLKLANPAGQFTGTVSTQATAGAVSVALSKATGFDFTVVPYDDGATVTYTVEISGDSGVTYTSSKIPGNTAQIFKGDMTVTAGTVTLDKTLAIDSKASVTVNNGATLVIGKNGALYAGSEFDVSMFNNMSNYPYDFDAEIENVTSVVIDGTLTVQGSINWGPVAVNGTMNVEKDGTVALDAIDVHGTLTVAEDAGTVNTLILVADGTITGDVGGIIFGIAYPASDLEGAVLNPDGNGEAAVESTAFYVNGALTATLYANAAYDIPIEILAIYAEIPGTVASTAAFYEDEAENDLIIDIAETTNFASTMSGYISSLVTAVTNSGSAPQLILSKVSVGDLETVYVTMDAAEAKGTISQGTGLALFIDNIGIESYADGKLTIGSHTVRYDVKAGYDGANATITFNGQTVENGGTIEITADMVKNGFTLVASGAVPADYASGSSSDGMGLTEILLVILVILIVVMRS